MKLFSLDNTPFEPISHDPQLRKRVLTKGTLPHVKHISHAVLPQGISVSEHSHAGDAEVFYCIRGKALFLVEGEEIAVRKGDLLIIGPNEKHSIPRVFEETELLYLRTASARLSRKVYE